MKTLKLFSILLLFVLCSCSKNDIIKNDIQSNLGDYTYFANDTSIGNPSSFNFANFVYVSDYVIFKYGSEKMIVIEFKGRYIAYCRIIENKYNQFNLEVSNHSFDLIDLNGHKVTYKK